MKRGRKRLLPDATACVDCGAPIVAVGRCAKHARAWYRAKTRRPRCTSGARCHVWTAAGNCKICHTSRFVTFV